jgi:hypothetical protein
VFIGIHDGVRENGGTRCRGEPMRCVLSIGNVVCSEGLVNDGATEPASINVQTGTRDSVDYYGTEPS